MFSRKLSDWALLRQAVQGGTWQPGLCLVCVCTLTSSNNALGYLVSWSAHPMPTHCSHTMNPANITPPHQLHGSTHKPISEQWNRFLIHWITTKLGQFLFKYIPNIFGYEQWKGQASLNWFWVHGKKNKMCTQVKFWREFSVYHLCLCINNTNEIKIRYIIGWIMHSREVIVWPNLPSKIESCLSITLNNQIPSSL